MVLEYHVSLNVNLYLGLAPNFQWLNLVTKNNYVFMCISLDDTQAFLERTILNEVCLFSNNRQDSTVHAGGTQSSIREISTKLSTGG